MKIVGGYFDSEADATEALDRLMNTPGYTDVKTRVLSSFAPQNDSPGAIAGGIIPQTSGGPSNVSGPGPAPIGIWRGDDMFKELDREEQRYFSDALNGARGGVLVLAEVDEDRAMDVRTLFSRMGGRTIEENK